MDPYDSPAEAGFRAARAFLAAHADPLPAIRPGAVLDRGGVDTRGGGGPPRGGEALAGGEARRRMGRDRLADDPRGTGRLTDREPDLPDGGVRVRRPPRRPAGRARLVRSGSDAARHGRAAGATVPAPAAGRRGVVPAVLRAGRRLGPAAPHPGAAGRRRVGDRRPEGVDHVRPSVRLGAVHRPHDPEAPRNAGLTAFMVDMRSPGVDHPTHPSDHRLGELQRGVPRRRPGSRLDADRGGG